jgi:hypothetical protein
MRGGHQIGLGENALDRRVRALSVEPRLVGHRYEYRAKRGKAADGATSPSISGVRGGKNSNETLSPGFAPSSKRRLAAKALRVVMRHSPRTSFAYNDVFI